MKNFLTLFLFLLVINSCSASYHYLCGGCGASLSTMCKNAGGTYQTEQAYCGSSMSTFHCCKLTTSTQRGNFLYACETVCKGKRQACNSCVSWP
ncbi:hypothetical protein BC940DRAFT_311525 [Gongronella butleri]|nr:hypothetical protein BC940DRAFT_311525 [Gongronella butleri]